MKYYHCMQLFGDCLSLSYLGKNRLRGPIDNIMSKKAELIELLLNNNYFNYLYSAPVSIEKNISFLPTDPEMFYTYDYFSIAHNDPFTDRFKETLTERINNFNLFYTLAKTINKDYFFTITYNFELFMSKEIELPKIIEILKKYNLLSKVIFVDVVDYTKEKIIPDETLYNLHSDTFKDIAFKNNIKHIRLSYDGNQDTLETDFQNKLNNLLIK